VARSADIVAKEKTPVRYAVMNAALALRYSRTANANFIHMNTHTEALENEINSNLSEFFMWIGMNELVEQKGEGWVPYSWPKPVEEKSSPKVSYVVLANHGSKNYVAGAGMFDVTPKNIKTKFPGDAVYEDE